MSIVNIIRARTSGHSLHIVPKRIQSPRSDDQKTRYPTYTFAEIVAPLASGLEFRRSGWPCERLSVDRITGKLIIKTGTICYYWQPSIEDVQADDYEECHRA
jgi:hypothetical protein